MRHIKFRGRDKRGNVFYGSYNQDMGIIDDWEYAACHAVDDKDVAQFVGYDKNGKEVYEGDVLVDEYGAEYEIGLQSTAYWKPADNEEKFADIPKESRGIPLGICKSIKPLTHKEKQS